jgi:dTDP-4-amino-4,6-dideoxygalactose transaminase
MSPNGPRILLIGGTYRAVCVLERLLERGERVVAFIGLEGGGERDFCPEILELCERAGIPARSGHKLGEEMVRWLEDRIRPDLALALGVNAEIPLSIGGNCRLGLVELSDVTEQSREVVLRQRGQVLVRRTLDEGHDDAGDAYIAMLDSLCECLDEFLERHTPGRIERGFSVPFEAATPRGEDLATLASRPEPGNATYELERRAAEYLGAEAVLALRSPRAAFMALARALRLAESHVLAPGVSSAAAIEGLRAAGVELSFADVHPDRLTLVPSSALVAITPRTRALLVSHPLGQTAELDLLYALAEESGVDLIEDACESLGARFGESRVGRSPCSAVFRLPLSPHAPGSPRALLARPDGWARDGPAAAAQPRAGAAAALLGLSILERWEDRLAARRRTASAYSAEFARYDAFRVPPTPEHALSSYSSYLLRLTRFARTAADDLSKLLAESGIETRRLRLPLSDRELAGLPATEHARATGLLLPADESLTDSQRDRVLDEIFGFAIG